MSLGLGIFLSALLISILLLFRWTRECWNWRKGLKKIAIWTFALFAVIGLSIWVYYLYSNRVIIQTSYYGIKLSMSKDEVLYIMGSPKRVLGDQVNITVNGSVQEHQWVIESEKIEKGKTYKDFHDWIYEPNSYGLESIDVSFDKQTGKVIEISCNGSCQPILNISNLNSENEVLERLGKPTQSKISDTTKTISYPDLNLFFNLERQKVYRLGVKGV